jgi:DNA-binding NarL/FixJ family response regulator
MIVADNSLIVEAIAIGLRRSGEFKVIGHVNGRSASAQSIAGARPHVVLLDDMGQSVQVVNLIREIKAEQDRIAVIVLTLAMDPEWLDGIFDAGATGAISKATPPLALTTLVRETINEHVVHVYRRFLPDQHSRSNGMAVKGSMLTPRELEVLQLVAAGSTNGEIARSLWVTERTVKFHLSNLYRKIDVGNRTEASHYAHVNGLVSARPPAGVSRGSQITRGVSQV